MRSILIPPAGFGRRVAPALLVLALLAGSAAGARAQEVEPEPQAEQPQASALAFTGDAGLIFNQIRPEHANAFEDVLNRLKGALAESEDPIRRQQAQSWKVYKAMEPSADGNLLYVFLIQPAVQGAEYDPIKILAEALPAEEVQELYENVIKVAYVSLNRVNLQLVSDFGTAAAPALPEQP